jgi:hydrogenase expression/formation protein HypC
MCLGIPGRVIEVSQGTDELDVTATVDFGGVLREVSLAAVPHVIPGEYVVVHAGFALSRLKKEEADRVIGYLDRLKELR